MIGYVTLGTNDLKRAAAFYDALLGEIGAKRMMESDEFVAWSVKPDLPGSELPSPLTRRPPRLATASWWRSWSIVRKR
jgi:catechol 2,3-dioxygenase-like lactoylglutathione lyase family enzyme